MPLDLSSLRDAVAALNDSLRYLQSDLAKDPALRDQFLCARGAAPAVVPQGRRLRPRTQSVFSAATRRRGAAERGEMFGAAAVR